MATKPVGLLSYPDLWRLTSRYFSNNPRFKQIDQNKSGASGTVVIYEETLQDKSKRKLVVKKVLGDSDGVGLQREMQFMRRLRWARHIVNIIDMTPSISFIVSAFDNNKRSPLDAGPVLAMEHLENGTLHQFRERYFNVPNIEPLPNRLVWAIFLCSVRAIIGMAYPPSEPEQLEVPPQDVQIQPLTLAHNDMHAGNFMFGDLNMSETEHSLIPILKLIDFGEAKDLDEELGPDDAPPRDPSTGSGPSSGGDEGNFDVSMNSDSTSTSDDAMAAAAARQRLEERRQEEIREYDDKLELWDKLSTELMIATAAHMTISDPRPELNQANYNESYYEYRRSAGTQQNILDSAIQMTRLILNDGSLGDRGAREDMRDTADQRLPNLDADLRFLIMRCLAVRPLTRPRPGLLLNLVQQACATRTEATYRNTAAADNETDEHINTLVREFILSAPTTDTPMSGTADAPIVI